MSGFVEIIKKRLDFSDYFYNLCGFLGSTIFKATIAQQVEHLTCNEAVAGSIPAGGSKK